MSFPCLYSNIKIIKKSTLFEKFEMRQNLNIQKRIFTKTFASSIFSVWILLGIYKCYKNTSVGLFLRFSHAYPTKSSVVKSFLKEVRKITLNNIQFCFRRPKDTGNVGQKEPNFLISRSLGKSYVGLLGWWISGASDKWNCLITWIIGQLTRRVSWTSVKLHGPLFLIETVYLLSRKISLHH